MPLRHAFDNIDQHDVGVVSQREHLGDGAPDHSGSDDCDLAALARSHGTFTRSFASILVMISFDCGRMPRTSTIV